MGGTLFPGVKATHQGYTTEKRHSPQQLLVAHGFNGGMHGSTPFLSSWKHWGTQSWARHVKKPQLHWVNTRDDYVIFKRHHFVANIPTSASWIHPSMSSVMAKSWRGYFSTLPPLTVSVLAS